MLQVPYFVILTPFIDYIAFQWLAFVLKYFYAAGSTASADIGTFIMTLMVTTFFYFEFIIAPWFIFKFVHDCGPIPDNKSGFEPIINFIYDKLPYRISYTLLSFPPIVYITLVSIFVLSRFS